MRRQFLQPGAKLHDMLLPQDPDIVLAQHLDQNARDKIMLLGGVANIEHAALGDFPLMPALHRDQGAHLPGDRIIDVAGGRDVDRSIDRLRGFWRGFGLGRRRRRAGGGGHARVWSFKNRRITTIGVGIGFGGGAQPDRAGQIDIFIAVVDPALLQNVEEIQV